MPFIGGVPISIERLRHGQQVKDKVLVVAPGYGGGISQRASGLITFTLFSFGDKSEFRFANIFSGYVRKIKRFKPDIIHATILDRFIGCLHGATQKPSFIPTTPKHYAHFAFCQSLFRNIIAHFLVRRFVTSAIALLFNPIDEYLRMIGVKPIYVQPTGIEFERFQRLNEDLIEQLGQQKLTDETVFVGVARLSNEEHRLYAGGAGAIKTTKRATVPLFNDPMVINGSVCRRKQNNWG